MDSVEAILRLVQTDAAVGEVVNVGGDHEITIEDLAGVIKGRTASSSSLKYIPYDEAYEPGFEDMLRRVPSLDKLQRLTNFRPNTQLSEIVDRVATHLGQRDKSLAGQRSKVAIATD